MSKVDYSGVPEAGSKWILEGAIVTVTNFQPHGRGGYVNWVTGEDKFGWPMTWGEWKKKAKAA